MPGGETLDGEALELEAAALEGTEDGFEVTAGVELGTFVVFGVELVGEALLEVDLGVFLIGIVVVLLGTVTET